MEEIQRRRTLKKGEKKEEEERRIRRRKERRRDWRREIPVRKSPSPRSMEITKHGQTWHESLGKKGRFTHRSENQPHIFIYLFIII